MCTTTRAGGPRSLAYRWERASRQGRMRPAGATTFAYGVFNKISSMPNI